MAKESRLEFQVGLFVLLALVALTVFIFSITDTPLFSDGKIVNVVFDFANGVKKGAPVRIAGVDEGLVKDTALFFDRKDSKTKAEIKLLLGKDIKIPADSTFMVNQLGLLGEKYIEVVPGMETTQFVEHGQTVLGKNPIAMESISQRVLEIADKIEDSIKGVNELIRDTENVASIKATLNNLNDATGGLKGIIEDVRQGKGTVGKLFYDDSLYENLQGLSADLKQHPWKLLHRPRRTKP